MGSNEDLDILRSKARALFVQSKPFFMRLHAAGGNSALTKTLLAQASPEERLACVYLLFFIRKSEVPVFKSAIVRIPRSKFKHMAKFFASGMPNDLMLERKDDILPLLFHFKMVWHDLVAPLLFSKKQT